MSTPDPEIALPRQVACHLVGGDVDSLDRVGGGRNSRVFCVLAQGRKFALKQYPSRADDPRDRLGTEVGALRLMERHGFATVPKVLAVDSERNFALLTWLDGDLFTELTSSDIDQASRFLAAVHALRLDDQAPAMSYAAEACLSGTEIDRQIEFRMAQLHGLEADEPSLRSFLGELGPIYAGIVADARASLAAAGLDFARELPQERRSLVPADFGFHNSLRRSDGTLGFLDFEYFGWDDPVKLTADVLLHPGTPLPPAQWARFRAAAEALYGTSDPSFHARLSAYYPLFGIRWVLILLNEFYPDRWRRRQLAGATEDWAEAKARQLDRARGMLATLVRTREQGVHAQG